MSILSRSAAALAVAASLCVAASHAGAPPSSSRADAAPLPAATPERPIPEPVLPEMVELHPEEVLLDALAPLAPDLDRNVLGMALGARECAVAAGDAEEVSRLAVIDFSLPSTEKRLWVFDIEARALLFAEHVAHGQGTGGNMATRFSNREGSHQSSLGLFAMAETYHGGNGYSLRMDGLEPGINDAARRRAIVMHGAPYVNPEAAPAMGRLGRSFGCPAVRSAVARQVIDSLKDGQMLFAYYPEDDWLAASPFLNCRHRTSGLAARAKAAVLQARAETAARTTAQR
ncbi:murein L,D-transpeptidase catalytic domain family protein [Coralloluteibacterium thermophilus]|uniref:Murein L,D-transpeptidase catalytic domain family protein n=1 Tax=Coralloluteibacterium thermophilum TaxID=2707049 RepID=A0ABV9NNP5_9GAMM